MPLPTVGNVLFYLFLFGVALSVPTDDAGIINDTGMDAISEITMKDEKFLMHIVPSGISSKKLHIAHKMKLSDFINSDSIFYEEFMGHVEKGHTLKALTFNIYDDNMREATIALFRLICNTDLVSFKKIKEWAKDYVNDHMFDYAERLCSLHSKHTSKLTHKAHEPPYLIQSNFYVNGETVVKYLKLKENIEKFNNEGANGADAQVNQYYKGESLNTIVINTNYSGWNLPQDGCGEKLDFFTEDIDLNAFYYGLHLMHPFWMSNNELDEINPRHAEHYYFNHKQLWARYELEKESARQRNVARNENCDDPFNPYLIYDNGLPFPIRSNTQGVFNEDKVKLYTINIKIKELLSRGFLFMNDGSKRVNLTEDNYIDLIAKMIRANYDSIETAKIARNLYGYGRDGYPKNIYNPAPSLLHQPETNLRDPGFWYLIELMLKYHTEFSQTLPPFNISTHEAEDFEIVETNITKLTTIFEYYQFELFRDENKDKKSKIPTITARHKRLSQLPWHINCTVKSKVQKDVILRIFSGPPCNAENCWKKRNNFFLLDVRSINIKEGYNTILWKPEGSNFMKFDYGFNKDKPIYMEKNRYNMFQFPQNILLPKGSENGVNMTLFIIATAADRYQTPINEETFYYNVVSFEYDTKPLDFPFNRPVSNFKHQASNYRFYNVTIYHKTQRMDKSDDFFSPHLY